MLTNLDGCAFDSGITVFLVHVVIVIVYVNFDPLFVVFSPAFSQLGAAEVFEAFHRDGLLDKFIKNGTVKVVGKFA